MNYPVLSGKVQSFFRTHSKLLRIGMILLWIVLLALLSWQIWQTRDQIPLYLEKLEWFTLLRIAFFYCMALIFAMLGWISIISAFISNISTGTHLKFYLATMAARRLPGTIWYISGRAILYKTLGISQLVTASASGIEIVISFLANCILAIIILPLGITNSRLTQLPYLIVGIVIGLLLVNPKSIEWFMAKINRPLLQPLKFWQPMVWVLIRVIVIISGALMVFQIVSVFVPRGIDVFWLVLGARALSGAASLITFFLPSSFGAADITLAAILTTRMSITIAGVVAIAVRLITSLFDIILGFLFYFIVIKKMEPEITV